MSAQSLKKEPIPDEIEFSDDMSEAEKMRALEILAATLRERNANLCNTHDKLLQLNDQLTTLRSRMEDINKRLDLALKSGIGSDSIH